MQKKSHSRRNNRRQNLTVRGCFFCLNEGITLDYKNPEVLLRFLSSRGKIVSRSRSGVCAKHQRVLSKSIKTARMNALLPFKADTVS